MHRYSRQELVLGKEKQRFLQQKKVAVVGLGALGSVAVELLARAGIGTLLLVDRDVVEENNLQRQMLYTEKDVGRSKVAAAMERLAHINSTIKLEPHATHLSAKNIELLREVGLILDCTDNLTTRFLLNDFCKKNKKKWIYAAAIKNAGYAMPIFPEGPCLRCFLQEASLETCDTIGVLNTITASIAALQVQLALEILTNEKVTSRLYHLNLQTKNLETLAVKKNMACLICQGKYPALQQKEEVKVVQFCSTGRYQICGRKVPFAEIKKRWEKIGKVLDDGATLSFQNIILFADGRALIKAKSEGEALSWYSMLVGN